MRIRPSSHDVWRCAGAVRLPKGQGLNGRFKCRTQGATFISTAAVSHIPELYFERGLAFPVCMSVPKGYARSHCVVGVYNRGGAVNSCLICIGFSSER